jgi:hypothetical protein
MTEEQKIQLRKEYGRWDWSLIPSHMWDGVKLWVENGIPGGSFQQSIMEHDFYSAIFRADIANKASIVGWAELLSWHLPSECHGSPERVAEWEKMGGLQGIYETERAD